MKEAKKLIKHIELKHKSAEIFGRNYELLEVEPETISKKLYCKEFSRKLGPVGTSAANYTEKRIDPFAVMPNHYENGWTGIIMTRDPDLIKEKRANPHLYAEAQRNEMMSAGRRNPR